MDKEVVLKLLDIVTMEEFDDIYDDKEKLALILRSKGLDLTLEIEDLLVDLRIIYSNLKEALRINKEIAKIVWEYLLR